MDVATFSTDDVGGYAVDGPFLAHLLERLQGVALKHGAEHLQTTVEIAMTSGPYGTVKRSHRDASPLLDGSHPQQPDRLTMMVYGTARVGDDGTSFVLSIDLNRAKGGFLMAQGPAALATEAFETIRGAMAAAERISQEPVRHPPMSPEAAERFAALRRSVLIRETLDAMRLVAPSACAIGLFGWGLFGPRGDAAWCLLMSCAMILVTLGQFQSHPERRDKRRRLAIESAREAGLPAPVREAGKHRSIDLSAPAPVEVGARLAHEPLVPLSI